MRSFFTATVALILVASSTRLAPAAEKLVDEFLTLPVADRRALIQVSLDERRAAIQNLRVTTTTQSFNVSYRNGVPGDPIPNMNSGRFDADLRLLNGDFRASIAWYLPNDRDRPNMRVETTINRAEGVARSIAEHGKLKGVYGAIDTKEDTFIRSIRYFYWFEGAFDIPSEFVFTQLSSHLDRLEFDDSRCTSDSIMAILELADENGRLLDRREMLLSPARGFLPVRIHRQHLRRKAADAELDMDYELVEDVLESRQIERVWFPWRTKIIATTSRTRRDGIGAVHEASVSNLEIGRLKSADLAVEFPNGTEVHDRIRGEWFQVGAPPPGTSPSAPPRNTGLLIGVNVTVVGLIVLVFALLRRPRPKTS